jgi:hypothetical protein
MNGNLTICDEEIVGHEDDETLAVVRDPENVYTHSEVVELFRRAVDQGFSLDAGGEIDGLTVRELENLVTRRM